MSVLAERLFTEKPVQVVSRALAGEPGVWLVGGTLRDALIGRPVTDVDLAVAGDPEKVARAVREVGGGAVFALSEEFGAWRTVAADRSWVCDVSPLNGDSIEADLAKRDFSVNAMALRLGEDGEPLDPHGGQADLEKGILRVLGADAYAEDPLRALRLVRLASELGFAPDEATTRLTQEAAASVTEASPERIWAELRRLVTGPGALEALALADRLGVMAAVLPELAGLHDVEQSHFHHLDVYDHTLEVFNGLTMLEAVPEEVFGELAPRVRKVLSEPLGDELTRGEALRFGALLHDVGKPGTRGVREDGRVTFIGHDRTGAEMIDALCERLRTSGDVRDFLASLTRHHLVLGFLVHSRPLDRRAVYRYLRLCEPVEVEVTLLSCADRLATRGRNAERAIAAHLDLAGELMEAALDWRAAGGAPAPPLRGDALARELGLVPGPELGELLEGLREARYAGEVQDADQAVEAARALRHNRGR